jgi:hypothetical protein
MQFGVCDCFHRQTGLGSVEINDGTIVKVGHKRTRLSLDQLQTNDFGSIGLFAMQREHTEQQRDDPTSGHVDDGKLISFFVLILSS